MDQRHVYAITLIGTPLIGVAGWLYGRRTARLEIERRETYLTRLTQAFLPKLAAGRPRTTQELTEVVAAIRAEIPPPELSKEMRIARFVLRRDPDYAERVAPNLLTFDLLERLRKGRCVESRMIRFEGESAPSYRWILTDAGRELLEHL